MPKFRGDYKAMVENVKRANKLIGYFDYKSDCIENCRYSPEGGYAGQIAVRRNDSG
jgi:hypothetical protein